MLAGLILLQIILLAGVSARADQKDVTALRASEMAKGGDVTLVDVRSAAEWRSTGVARGARTVTIHDPKGAAGFVAHMTEAVGGDRSKPIAVICARGNRSLRAQTILRKAGFTNVYNVADGMLGRGAAMGWIGSGLPVEKCTKC